MSENGFGEFWSEYPRKVAKIAASKAFEKALTQASAEEIMAGLKAFNDHLEKHPRERQYIPHCTTWLNQGRWADEHEAKVTPQDQMNFDEQRRAFIRRYESDPEFWGRFDNMLKLYNVGPYSKQNVDT